MKLIFKCLFIFSNFLSFAQGVVPTVDFNNFLVSFENGFFRQIEVQPVSNLKAGDEFVTYLDTRGNLRIYDGKERKDITLLNAEYEVSDHLMAYKIAGALRLWDAGQIYNLTNFAMDFAVRDSLVVYQDRRYSSVNVYWNKQMIPIMTLLNEVKLPSFIGENILVFNDNSNTYHAFWRGKNYEIGTYNDEKMNFNIGTDVFCFNDPYSQTFVVFQDGIFTEVESMLAQNFKSGRGFVTYQDINGNLYYYSNNDKFQLSNFAPNFTDTKDDITIWGESNYLFAFVNGEKKQIANYIPKDYKLKNNICAFRNIMGGVSAVINGRVEEITNLQDAEYEIYGNKVLVKLFNKSIIVFSNGKKFTN
jgi:hypothetical protein